MPGEYRRIGIKVPPSKDAAEAMDVAYDVLASGARRVGEAFTRPADDWRPQWLVLTRTQGTLVMGDAEKHAMAEAVGRLARKFGAIAVGHLHSAWIVDAETAGGQEEFERLYRVVQQQGGSTEGLPRKEIVLLAVYCAAEARQYHATIERHEDAPPTLGPFELAVSTADGLGATGAMVDPIVAALKTTG